MEETCDNCPKRGQCCKNFNLAGAPKDHPWAYTSIESRKTIIKRLKKENLPFIPTKTRKFHWLFDCPKIDRNGKCTIYHNRPKLCEDYRIGATKICYYYKEETR